VSSPCLHGAKVINSAVWFLLIAFSLQLLAACSRSKPSVSLAPEDFIATAQVPEDLKIELAAREPNVVDPVCMAFDEDGRMYVAEMRDYPTGPGEGAPLLGRVQLLEDTDLDGYFDKATTFADGLRTPTSVLPWRGGVLVATPPDIVFLKDTSGDGKADVRETLFTGFPAGNTQHNINGLIWGLDNWVYGGNGGNHGSVHALKKPDKIVSLQRMDFRFRPDTGEIQPSYETTGGFGIAVDQWGRMFGTHNTNHVQHLPLRAEYLARNPALAPLTSRHPISDHESMAKLYQVSDPETRVNHPEQSGRFSAGCGITYYGGGSLPQQYDNSLFINDVVVNIVHQDVLIPSGASFKARRGREGVEFLGGHDNWFRPVNLAVGPEGALFLLDFHRAVIEHPEWIPDTIEKQLNLRAGDDKGRIYRIVPREGLKPIRPQLSKATIEDLVATLAKPNKWWRDTAQRMLVERRDRAAIPSLIKSVRSSQSPQARLHALWTLEGLEALDSELILAALTDPEPGVRENALRLTETRLAAEARLRDAILGMTRDANARVRFQLALTLGYVEDSRAVEALLQIIRQDVEDPWTRYAALSSMRGSPGKSLAFLLAPGDPFRSESTDGRRDFVRQVASLASARNDKTEVAAVLRILRDGRLQEEWKVAGLDGLADGLARGRYAAGVDPQMRSEVDGLIQSSSTPVVRASLRVAAQLGIQNSAVQGRVLARAQKRALDESLPVGERIQEVELLSLGTPEQGEEPVLALMETRQPLELQVAAARTLAQFAREQGAQTALSNWRRYSPQVKAICLNMFLRRPAFHELLLNALEKKQLTFGELNMDLEQRRRLLWHATDNIKGRAAALFGDHEFSNRSAVVGQYLAEVSRLRGSPERGEKQYKDFCAKCHVLHGIGTEVGPDLAMAFTKSKEDLLTSILDPNTAIPPEYTNYMVVTTKGEQISGIIKTQTPGSLTLIRASGETDTILRSQIKEMRTDGLSLMPEGLEQGLKAPDLADLLAFLQQRH
jgi:putative membrane-bound dehydrogenase-like protein